MPLEVAFGSKLDLFEGMGKNSRFRLRKPVGALLLRERVPPPHACLLVGGHSTTSIVTYTFLGCVALHGPDPARRSRGRGAVPSRGDQAAGRCGANFRFGLAWRVNRYGLMSAGDALQVTTPASYAKLRVLPI